MSYENAPATKMLATHCCACARPLLDAASVTAGLGPHCRKKHGIPNDLDEATRERANHLIYQCAKESVAVETLQAAVVELALLGCAKLADRISKRAGRIVVTVTESAVDVRAPYSQTFLDHRGSGRWVRSAKLTRYTKGAALEALAAIEAAFPNALVRFEVGDDAPAFPTREALRAALTEIAESSPKSPCPPVQEVKWGASWTKLSGGWGVKIKFNQHTRFEGQTPKAGERVRVTNRAGQWKIVELAVDARVNRYRDAWIAEIA